MKFTEMLYKRPDINAYINEVNKLIETVKNAKSYEEQLLAHKKFTGLSEKISSMSTIAHIRNTMNTEDDFYDRKGLFDEQPSDENPQRIFYRALYLPPQKRAGG